MHNFTVEILQRAVFEIRDIYRYIQQDNPSAAHGIYDEIYQAVASIAHFPHKGFSVDNDDKAMNGWKFVTVKPYLIFYKINGAMITVYHVIDGRQYIKILKAGK